MLAAQSSATCPIAFREDEFIVKTLEEAELDEAYRLRHRVYAEQLGWVPLSSDQCDIDRYDSWASSVGIFQQTDQLVGVIRLLPSTEPFMLEKEFKAFLSPGVHIRKQPDTNEITRLAIDPSLIHLKGLSARILRTLLKGLYLWTVENWVRYSYMVVEERFLRVLNIMGFPAKPICSPITLPPAGARSVAAILDWDEFRCENSRRRPEFLEWISRAEVDLLSTGKSNDWRDALNGSDYRETVLAGYGEQCRMPIDHELLAKV